MPKFCIDCKHFQRDEKAKSEETAMYWGLCTRKPFESTMSLVTGRTEPEYLTARIQRSLEITGCGPSGLWWEAKNG